MKIIGGQVNKLDLVKKVMEECRISRNEATIVVDLFFGKMSEALANGERVEIRGLCSFHVREYKPYQGKNPKLERPLP